jgi:hypothetical protein
MCYSWHENVEKSVQSDVAEEDRRKTVPEQRPDNRVRSGRLRFWTFRVGRRDRATEEATADRVLEKV